MSTDSRLRQLAPLLALLFALAAPALGAELLELSIKGLRGEQLQNVRAALAIERRRQEPGLDADTIRELHAEAPAQIARALQPFGYYSPEIDARLQAPVAPGGTWQANYRIKRGAAVPVAELAISFDGPGASDPALAVLAGDFELRRGEPLDHRRYETAKRQLLKQVQEMGYRDAAIRVHRVEVNLASYAADIALSIDTGSRYVVGDINLEQSQFDPDYLRRYLVLQPGDPYAGSQLARQRQVLSKTGFFREVLIEPQPATDGPPPAIPLDIRLEPYKPNRYRGSLGWGTDSGFGGQLDWTRRYVGGRGQRFTAGVAAVEERNKLAGNLSYLIPVEPLTGEHLELVARYQGKDLNYEDVDLDEGGETRITTNLLSVYWHPAGSTWRGFELDWSPGLSFVTENYDVFEVLFGNLSNAGQQAIIDAIGPQAFDTLSPDFNALVPSVSFNVRRSDDRLFIRDGDSLSLELLGSHEKLGSNITFWQARLDSWHIRPMFVKDRLLLRSNFGYSHADNREVLGVNFNRMPEYFEFRAGGVRSVRGYGWESLFPKNTITGGKNEVTASIEYEHELIPNWGVAAFFDAGNAFNDFDDIRPRYGTGLGLRWRSPVGLARIDVGVPVADSKKGFEVYITVGPEF
ncbi:MAG: BamA/TamA family outer membrane protein [Halieaceae bacterium]|jgi:translocation and assembly module TamA|nr:BamA/TamA family outer membrane protein [Halieaceae bacterium]